MLTRMEVDVITGEITIIEFEPPPNLDSIEVTDQNTEDTSILPAG